MFSYQKKKKKLYFCVLNYNCTELLSSQFHCLEVAGKKGCVILFSVWITQDPIWWTISDFHVTKYLSTKCRIISLTGRNTEL